VVQRGSAVGEDTSGVELPGHGVDGDGDWLFSVGVLEIVGGSGFDVSVRGHVVVTIIMFA
jgi:hypothetical protein